MRYLFTIAAGLAAAVALAVGAALAAPPGALMGGGAGATARGPLLGLVDTDPLTLRGLGFKPHERVAVRLSTVRRAVWRTVASGAGAFTLRMPGVEDTAACTGFSATATGEDGSKAVFKRVRGQCALP
jgi:hypothetical protein